MTSDNEEILREMKELKKEIRELRKEGATTNSIVQSSLSRISQLEIKDARREGVESVSKGSTKFDYGKVVLAALGVATAAITLATIIANSLKGSAS